MLLMKIAFFPLLTPSVLNSALPACWQSVSPGFHIIHSTLDITPFAISHLSCDASS